MAKKVFFVLLVGAVLISGLALANQQQKTDVRDARLARAVHYDENWAVRNGELYKFDSHRDGWLGNKGGKQEEIDTLLYFTAEGPSWNDVVAGSPWQTVDNTTAWADTMWHRDTFKAISGSYSMWWGDPEINGYDNDRYQALIGPKIYIDPAYDSLFLTYTHLIKCEEMSGIGQFEGWDGYNVRIKVAGADTMYEEQPPYKVAADSSYYTHPPANSHEWNILRCWERHGEMTRPGGGYGPPYDQWIGGYANDNDNTTQSKMFDLRSFAGDTIQICFVGASDWGACTIDDGGDTSWFGYIIDNVLLKDYKDNDTLMFDNFESAKGVAWTLYTPNVPTGNWWWLASGGHSGIYKAMCSDPFSGRYPENCENAFEAPKIAHADLPDNLANLDLNWYLKCQMTDLQAEECGAYNQYKLDDGEWTHISVLTGPAAYYYGLSGVTNAEWWNCDQWSDFMHNMTPLATDSTIVWDTLQVRIGFFSNSGADTVNTIGLQVDDVVLSGRIGAPYDLGVTAMKIRGPNANDVQRTIDSVAIYNYGFNTASSGAYQVFMTVLDSNHVPVYDTTQVLGFGAPNILPLETKIVALDPAVAKFTLTQEGSYDIKIFTKWSQDTEGWNDTLKTVYTETKADYYPGFYNYPAGQGQLRCHDQGFYNYPYINIRIMDSLEVVATHFIPESQFYPFDMRLGLPEMKEVGETYNFKVWGSGNTPDAAPLLATIPFTTDNTGELGFVRIELDTIDVLQHYSSDFWMGVEFPAGTSDYVMGAETAENDQPGRNWGKSYIYEEDDSLGWGWYPYDWDWVITAVISWRTVTNPVAMPSKTGPKNSSGNLYLDWANVSQAHDYLIYRSTSITASFPFLDSTADFTSNYTDNDGVVGSTTTHYYYLFNTRHQDMGVYDKTSKAIGEFDKLQKNAK